VSGGKRLNKKHESKEVRGMKASDESQCQWRNTEDINWVINCKRVKHPVRRKCKAIEHQQQSKTGREKVKQVRQAQKML